MLQNNFENYENNVKSLLQWRGSVQRQMPNAQACHEEWRSATVFPDTYFSTRGTALDKAEAAMDIFFRNSSTVGLLSSTMSVTAFKEIKGMANIFATYATAAPCTTKSKRKAITFSLARHKPLAKTKSLWLKLTKQISLEQISRYASKCLLTSMSLTVASLAFMYSSSCNVMSREFPVDSFPSCNT